MIAFGVQNPKDDDAAALDAVEKLVRETAREQPVEGAVVGRTPFGLLFQKHDRSLHLLKKLITQTCPLCLVPPTGLTHIGFGAGTDEDSPFHAPVCLRRRASTSGQGEPAVGVLL